MNFGVYFELKTRSKLSEKYTGFDDKNNDFWLETNKEVILFENVQIEAERG